MVESVGKLGWGMWILINFSYLKLLLFMKLSVLKARMKLGIVIFYSRFFLTQLGFTKLLRNQSNCIIFQKHQSCLKSYRHLPFVHYLLLPPKKRITVIMKDTKNEKKRLKSNASLDQMTSLLCLLIWRILWRSFKYFIQLYIGNSISLKYLYYMYSNFF